jgi:hypothetical protein
MVGGREGSEDGEETYLQPVVALAEGSVQGLGGSTVPVDWLQ